LAAFSINAIFSFLPAILLMIAVPAMAQELEPQRWRHLPIDTNFATVAYVHKDDDIALDPILGITNAESSVETIALAYTRTFALFGHTAQVEIIQPWQYGKWSGTVAGEPTTVSRNGLADTRVGFAVQLFGAPALEREQYTAYRASPEVHTNGGVGISVQLPTGQYKEDKLINLGTNRYTFRPEVGLVHDRGDWGLAASGSISFYTDNTSYFNGNRLAQDPLYFAQANALYRFRPDLWSALGVGYAIGAESSVNGVDNNDRRENLLLGIAAGYSPIPWLSLQFKYIRSENLTDIGSTSNRYIVSLSTFW
jgi:hypothetical protein